MEPLSSWGSPAPQPENAAGRTTSKLRTFPLWAGRKRLFGGTRDRVAPKPAEPLLRPVLREAEPSYDNRDEFLTRMRHELMTPLNAVLGFGRLLQQQAVSSTQEDCARQVVRGGERLLQMIDELLEASRLSNPAGEPDIEPVPLAEIVQAVVEETQDRAAKRNILIRVCSEPSRPCLVLTDRRRLRQILLRLLALAVKLSTEGSVITLDYDAVGGQVRLCIHNGGPSIPIDGAYRLLPAGGTQAQDTAGLREAGISLVLCKHLVEALHGTFGVESAEGHGSTFWVQLAAAEHDEPLLVATEDAATAYPPQGNEVLYIDDDESNLKLIEYLIAANGDMSLLTATTGRAGVEIASTHLPSLILLDLHLHDLSGEEVLARLRVNSATRNIPVVAVSGESDPVKIRRLKEAGVSSYLSKPLNLPQVQKLLVTILKRPVPQHSAA